MVLSSQVRPTRADSVRRDGSVCADGQQPPRMHRFVGTLDLNELEVTENYGVLDQSCGGLAEHDSAGRRDGLHPLGHADLLADSRVTRCARTDFAGDDLAGVQADSQLATWCRRPSGSPARPGRRGKRGLPSVIGAPNTAMMPSPVNLSTVPP